MIYMKNVTLLISMLVICQLVMSQTKIFKGAWFEITYPSSFIAKGSLRSETSDGFESATFRSPDNSVEFYVFSPQWSGVAKDIAISPNEKISASTSQVNGGNIIKWWTIGAKDGSYSRSYQEKINKDQNTNWIIGIKYKNSSGLEKYKKEYSLFKSSLKQFAD